LRRGLFMFSFQNPKKNTRIGYLLVKKGLITKAQLDEVIGHQNGSPLGQILIEKHYITRAQLSRSLQKQSLIRVFAVIAAFIVSPFHMVHAQSQNPVNKSHKTILNVAKAETAINIDNVFKKTENTNVLKDQIYLSMAASWDVYDEVLKLYAKEGILNGQVVTLVNFKKLREDKRFTALIKDIAEYPLVELETLEEELAFYINAYNILAMNMVSKNWPLKKLTDLGSIFTPVWTHHAGVIGGRNITLRELEHSILRKFGEPRIHFAINCASVSCPNLRLEAYRPEAIYSQLDEQTVHFMKDNKGVNQKGSKLYLSKIFKWFKEDFDPVGGVESFIVKYRPDLKDKTNRISYQIYDWEVTKKLTRSDIRRLKS